MMKSNEEPFFCSPWLNQYQPWYETRFVDLKSWAENSSEQTSPDMVWSR